MSRSKSRREEGRQCLGDAKEDLLLTLANLHDDALAGSVDKLLRGVLKPHRDAFAALFALVPGPKDVVIHRFRYYLRQAWTAEPRARSWFLLRAREVEARLRAAAECSETDFSERNVAIEKALDELPAITPLETAFVHLQKLQDSYKTLRCANPECSQIPYFILRKKGQRFCSDICANVKRREDKKRWWTENRGGKAKKGEHNAKRSDRKNQ